MVNFIVYLRILIWYPLNVIIPAELVCSASRPTRCKPEKIKDKIQIIRICCSKYFLRLVILNLDLFLVSFCCWINCQSCVGRNRTCVPVGSCSLGSLVTTECNWAVVVGKSSSWANLLTIAYGATLESSSSLLDLKWKCNFSI